MTLTTPIVDLKGVGPDVASKLEILGVKTVGQLVANFPRRYEDYSHVTEILHLKPGPVTIEATIGSVNSRYVRRGLHITEAIASDATGSIRLTWFNQPYRAAAIKGRQAYFIAGEFALKNNRFGISNPSVELVSDFPVNTARIIPIYRETKGLKSSTIRKLVREALGNIKYLDEHLPVWLVEGKDLIDYTSAVKEMHFPSTAAALDSARRRLGFEEVFELSLAALLNKYELYTEKAISVSFNKKLAREFVSQLPFSLTDAQRKVIWQIYRDIEKTQPMNRLVEGDVGSGKTVVATMAALMAIEQGYQVALMAPTEILARQHADTLYKLLSSVGYGGQVGLLVGSMPSKQKDVARAAVASGDIRFIVGTHALITDKVDMHKLNLAVIDEQHRFGVDQRKKLQAKAGHMPHVLHMTATPIPRSLALTLYGELDVSVLDELPPGRKKIITEINSPNSRKQLNKKIETQLDLGRQMFVVCPLISESETMAAGLSAEAVFERMSKHEFKHRRVALLHGRLKSFEKEKVMKDFVEHKYDILVSTTVIEVGVDVPNASIMLIEGAERFGLAQAHQLRGRVGRGAHQSYCYIVPSDSRAPSQRLKALETIIDGFKLAELDLQLRGPGAIYGHSQHGELDLRVASLTDMKLIAEARNAAQEFIDKKEDLSKFHYLNSRVSALRAVTNLN